MLNVVLFHKAARVEAIEIPEGTEIEASTGQMYEEGWETEYAVIEWVPPTPAPAETAADDSGWPDFAAFAGARCTPTDPDYREPTLRIDMGSIKVHVVQRVEFETVVHDVGRHRWEKREPNF